MSYASAEAYVYLNYEAPIEFVLYILKPDGTPAAGASALAVPKDFKGTFYEGKADESGRVTVWTPTGFDPLTAVKKILGMSTPLPEGTYLFFAAYEEYYYAHVDNQKVSKGSYLSLKLKEAKKEMPPEFYMEIETIHPITSELLKSFTDSLGSTIAKIALDIEITKTEVKDKVLKVYFRPIFKSPGALAILIAIIIILVLIIILIVVVKWAFGESVALIPPTMLAFGVAAVLIGGASLVTAIAAARKKKVEKYG
ncbi:MAG: hypothetical protein QW253_00150 [Metallosphaera sp.]